MAERADDIHIALRLARGDFRMDLDLRLPGSGCSVVFGPSGCGKSTLLRAIAGLEPRAHGEIRVGEACWQDARSALPAHRRGIGMVFQHSALLPHLSVVDNLRFGWKRARAAPELLERWIERLALAPLLSRKPDSLSGGGWRWRARWSATRACCCWTNR